MEDFSLWDMFDFWCIGGSSRINIKECEFAMSKAHYNSNGYDISFRMMLF